MIKVILHLFLCMIVFFLSYKDLQQQEVPSSVNPQYENVPGPPQSSTINERMCCLWCC